MNSDNFDFSEQFFRMSSDVAITDEDSLQSESNYTSLFLEECLQNDTSNEFTNKTALDIRYFENDFVDRIDQQDVDSMAECGTVTGNISTDINDVSSTGTNLSDASYLKIDSEIPLSTTNISHDKLVAGLFANTTSLDSISSTIHSTFIDLNIYVSDLIKSTFLDSEEILPVTKNSNTWSKKRVRKSIFQTKTLNKILKQKPEWDKESMKAIADKTGLSYHQVYKWYWDKKQKGSKPLPFCWYIKQTDTYN